MTNDLDCAGTHVDEAFDDLVEQVIDRLHAGDTLPWDEYASRYPQHVERLKELLPSIRQMVDLRSTLGRGRDAPREGAIPLRVGRYRVIEALGQGGFATAYLAEDEELQRRVVVKVPHSWRAPADGPHGYVVEARILAQLEHPAIVPVYDVGQLPDGRWFIVSKHIPGSDLATRLRLHGRPSPREAAELVARIALALRHVHQQGIVHRDVKPANILLDEDGHAFLGDFGVALCDADFGKDTGLAGTISYMSPEQARGEGHRVDGRSDIYSLGIVLYELLTGSTPFRRDSRAEQIEEILHAQPRPPRQLDDTIPPELEAICLKCLAKDPAERYSAAGDLSRDLRRWIGRERPWLSRRVLMGTAAAAAVILPLFLLVPKSWWRPDLSAGAGTSPQIESVELHLRRDRDDERIESHTLVQHGVQQGLAPLAPLGPDDDFKLYVTFKATTHWYLVHVDPAGGVEIVDRSDEPEDQLEFPREAEMAGFKPDDPKGVNLLLLITGGSGPEDEARLREGLTFLEELPKRPPMGWSRLRAGVTKDQSLAQLPDDALKGIEARLPEGLKPAYGLFLYTIAPAAKAALSRSVRAR